MSDASRPGVVYHGTSVEQWTKDNRMPDGLYVTVNKNVAEDYAREWAEEGHTPLVVTVPLGRLDGMDLGPNLETVQQYADMGWEGVTKDPDDLTWRDTLEMNGTFTLTGFGEAEKGLCQTAELGATPTSRF